MRLRFKIVAVFAVGLIIMILGLVVPRPLWPVERMTTETRNILVLSNPIHTDIALPVDRDLLSRFGFLNAQGLDIENPGIKYLVFGWGGRAFYTETPRWADIRPLPVLKAFTVDSSVMHVEVAGDIDEANPHVVSLPIDAEHYAALLSFIDASFQRKEGQTLPLTGFSYGEYDAFYEANGYFNMFFGCNSWTAAALRQAGIRTSWWSPLPSTLRFSISSYNGDRNP